MKPRGSTFVPGTPIPQGSAKGFVVGKHVNITHDNDAVMPWRSDVAARIRATIGPTIAIPAGPVRVGLTFVMPRRANEPKGPKPHTTRPDLDKLCRAVLDAMTGLVFTDDAQVTELDAAKVRATIGEQPGAHVHWEAAAE